MKIVSWNVNGLRSATRKGFGDWLATTDADVVCLQEVRALPEQLDEDIRAPEGWHVEFVAAQKKGYSGVALYSRAPIDQHTAGLGEERFDSEGRLQTAQIGEWCVVNGYFPNGSGKNRDLSRIPYKLDFYDAVRSAVEAKRAAGDKVVVVGDWNTAHRAIDLARPQDNQKTSGFRPEERASFDTWFDEGWRDTFRARHPQREGAYSWWSNRVGVRERNVGWRIDYIVAAPSAFALLDDAGIDAYVLGSDHCPVWASFRSS
ncbi:MAG: exodeoxyribonuclease-3 [Bradymonadia bacterium]|jgi:exodeoxyribonuclease-3